jgi:hypothetical protein
MFSTCIFCHAALGAIEAIEHFPVGRRLAFDAARGRLWVVCPACGRWKLTPIEERWEAVEECERRFRGTVLRRSTDQIGLARLDVFGDRTRMFAFMSRTPDFDVLPEHPGVLARLPAGQRLALEMVVHEETEEEALRGELAALERAWREAEEVARIADDLLVPAAVVEWLARYRARPRD